jgi:hypothetical protein
MMCFGVGSRNAVYKVRQACWGMGVFFVNSRGIEILHCNKNKKFADRLDIVKASKKKKKK